MKRLIACLILTTVMCCAGFAETSAAEKSFNFTTGGFWSCQSGLSGGYGEFGIKLFDNSKGFLFRDCIMFEGFGATGNYPDAVSAAAFGNKLIIGQSIKNNGFAIGTYGLLSLSCAMFRAEEHDFLNPNLMLKLSCGMGFELKFAKNMAYVIECGGSNNLIVGPERNKFSKFASYSPFLSIGYRSFM